MNYIAWDYEENATPPQYHIYAYAGPLEVGSTDLFIEAPNTPTNTANVEIIVQALERISENQMHEK